MKKLLICSLIIIIAACHFKQSELLGDDIRLWKDTPAWQLAKAVSANDTNKVNKILSKGELSIDYQEPKFGESLLHWAVLNNEIDIVHFLLGKGANPNLHDHYNGESPIALSCESINADPEILRLLLRYGGNPNDYVKEDEKVTYEHSKRTPLTYAATRSLEKVKLLVEAGADIEMELENRKTALYWATLTVNFDIARYLLIECKANYNNVYSIRNYTDTIRFPEMLTIHPYLDSPENKEYIRQMREFVKQSEKDQ